MTQTVLVVEDDADLAEALCDTLELAGYRVERAADGEAALALLSRRSVALVVSDVQMRPMDGHALLRAVKQAHPRLPVLLMTAYGSIERAVGAMREGAADYLAKPFTPEALRQAVAAHIGPPRAEEEEAAPVAVDAASRRLLALVERVAGSEATVLLTGESGTGKEVMARYLHRRSQRATGPFVAINCAAIPENMLEATLFGHEKGAFTGAHKANAGKFEQAQSGTLLLDEISEMDLALQAKLLRVLQERELERLGGSRTIPLDVRVLATTNRNLRAEVAAGRFREDLFYRLNVFPLEIPPLRARRADITPLAERLLARAARAAGRPVPTLSPQAHRHLEACDWPGNVRELDNLLQRALVLQPGTTVEAADLQFEPVTAGGSSPVPGEGVEGLADDLKKREFDLIAEALESGSRKAAAERLGISPRTLRYKLAQMREAGYNLPERVGA